MIAKFVSEVLIVLFAALGFGAGLVLFFRGFRLFHKYRILADTPRALIGGMPMGLVEIHGKAEGSRTVTAPISQSQCLFYRVDATLGGLRGTEFGGDQFYLRDSSGSVLIDACGAELDLVPTAVRKFRGGHGTPFRKAFSGEGDPFLTTGDKPSGYALETYAVEVLANQRYKSGIRAWLRQRSIEAKLSEEERAGRRFQLREYCIFPDRWYDVTGTCIENPRPDDSADRNMIVKGQNEPLFLISSRTEGGLEGTLRDRGLVRIIIGSAAAIACLVVVVSKLGWL